MEKRHTQQRVVHTSGIHRSDINKSDINKSDIHRSKIHRNNQKMKKATACILCFAFLWNLSLQTIAGRAETVSQGQAQETNTENTADIPQKTAVTFSELNDNEVFLKQSQAHVCTLTASAMMIRRAAMLSGNKDWRQITEQSVRKYAWAEKTGLKWNFTAAGISVAHKTLSSKNELIRLLDKHPEGIVIYNSRKPHAILVTDYTDGIFYCSDPSNDKPYGRYPIAQASITAESAKRCWYVKKPVNLVVDRSDAQQSDQIVDGLMYRILDTEKKTAVCTGSVSDQTVVNIPETVRIQEVEYQVAQISESAFADSDKLKEVTVGANVVLIEPKAFYQCKKLQKLTIHADHLQQIGADAFAKIHKKAQILMIGEQTETFTALLSDTSVPTTVTVGFERQ